MVGTLGIAALILTAAIATFIMYRANESAVRGTVMFVDRIRWIVGMLFLGIIAYHLLQSGSFLYIVLALLGFMFLTGYLLVEKPWSEVV